MLYFPDVDQEKPAELKASPGVTASNNTSVAPGLNPVKKEVRRGVRT